MRFVVLLGLMAAAAGCSSGRTPAADEVTPAVGMDAIQQRLRTGWNTWDSRSVVRQVLLPDAFAINLAFKERTWIEESYLGNVLIGRTADGAEEVVPGRHTLDGSYTTLELTWRGVRARVESGHDGGDLVVLVTPLAAPAYPVTLVIESAMLWNRPGALARRDDRIEAVLPSRTIAVFATGSPVDDPFVPTTTPYMLRALDGPIGLATGQARSVEAIRGILDVRRREAESQLTGMGELADAATAVEAGLAWNVVYDPRNDRVMPTVGRQWNEEYGGYALFGWDNFFLPYAAALFSRDLAFAGVLGHLAGATDEGFIPNDNAGNGRRSYDRSQPPVGALMVRAIARRHPERWFLDASFDPLLAWNRWWPRARLNDGLLAYGSHAAPNPFAEPDRQSMVTAGYESGMDDSPMYDGVPYDPTTGTMAIQDVGLTSLYIADCDALAAMADLLGRTREAVELRERAAQFRRALADLWSETIGLYLNRRTDTGQLSTRLSPTLFYPLLAGVPDEGRARRMIEDHLRNPDEFWGPHVIPSIARSDPDFPRQRYWKGAIWPPLNFLTYVALGSYEMAETRTELAHRSLDLFMAEWRRRGYVSENYSALTGTGDDERLSSDRFHSWGVLMALPSFIDAGLLPDPAARP